jgi:hypothetical protein
MVRRSTSGHVLAERQFPVRLRIAVPPRGFGNQLNAMHAWLDEHVGKGNYAAHGFNQPGMPEACLWYFLDVGMGKAFADRFGLSLALIEPNPNPLRGPG